MIMPEEEVKRYAVTPQIGEVFFSSEQLQLIGSIAGPRGHIELNSFMQLIVQTHEEDLPEQHHRLRAAGLGVYPVGPAVKNLHTCTFCMGERIDGLPDAQRLDQAIAGAKVPFPIRVGFSGCANNCGEAIVRDIGIVRIGPDRYDIFIGGKAGSLTPRFGEKVAEGVTSEQLVPAVEALLNTYRERAKGKERLWKNIGRLGVEPYKQAADSVRN
jgi:precorrin-3B C17-methyltransferase